MAVLAAAARRRVLRRTAAELPEERLLLSAVARAAAWDGTRNRASAGAAVGQLMLFASGLYFHSYTGARELVVAGAAISWIGVPEGRRGGRGRIVVRFLNAAGKEDAVTLQLLSPAQWVQAIKTHLISRAH